jgi:hypothetical protein
MFKEDDPPNGGHDRRPKERGNWRVDSCMRLMKDSKTGQCDGKGCKDCIRFSMFNKVS